MRCGLFGFCPGTVISRNDATVSIELQGLLVHLADVGDKVVTDDVLAEVDTRTMELNRREALARIKEIEPRLDFYKKEADRLASLADADNISRSASEEAAATRDELAGQLRTAQLRLAIARDNLRKSRVLAPHDGVVAARLSEPGEFVKEGEDLLRLVDIAAAEIRARVPDDIARYMRIGQPVPLMAADGDVEKIGRLRVLVPVADASRLYEVRVTLPAGENWPVGMATRVFFSRGAVRTGILVPRDALVIRSFGIHVFRIADDNKVEQVPVRVGEGMRDDKVEVLGDLQAGDQLVVRGGERLLPGQTVVIASGEMAGIGREGSAPAGSGGQ